MRGALNTMRAASKRPPSSAFRRRAPGSGPGNREKRDDLDGDECSHRMLESVSTSQIDGKESSAMLKFVVVVGVARLYG